MYVKILAIPVTRLGLLNSSWQLLQPKGVQVAGNNKCQLRHL